MTTSAENIARTIADLKRRLANLEASSQLGRSSVNVGDGAELDLSQSVLAASPAPLRFAKAMGALVNTSLIGPAGVVIQVFFTDNADDIIDAIDGDFWFDPSSWVLYYRTAGAWAPHVVQDFASDFSYGYEGLVPGDGKMTTYWQTEEPVIGDHGDLWFRADQSYTPYRWDLAGWTPLVVREAAAANFVEAEGGWGFQENGNAQVQDLAALGQLGVPLVNADSIMVGGEDLVDKVNNRPEGLKVHAMRGAGFAGAGTGAGPISNVELRAWELNAGVLKGGHTYELRIRSHMQRTVADDAFDLRIRYTTDGSEAVVSSPVFLGSLRRFVLPQNTDIFYSVSIDVPTTATYRFALTGQRAVGTGTATMYVGDTVRRFEWDVVDQGVYSGNDNNSLSQTLKADGTGSDNPPINTYTLAWDATLSDNFYDAEDFGSLKSGDFYYGANRSFMTQGYADSTYFHADQSLCMFNYSDIIAKLASAISITGCKLRFTSRSRVASTGLDVYVATHNFTSLPTEYQYDNTANIFRNVATKANAAPGSTYVVDLGAAVGAQFKAGTRRGIGFVTPHGNKSSYLMGTIYGSGATAAQKPQLQITYTKAG